MSTRAQLRTRAQQRADMENSNFVGTSEWNTYIDESLQELYDLVVAVDQDRFVDSFDFTLSGSANTFNTTSLVTVFKSIRALDYLTGSGPDDFITVPRFVFEERGSGERSYRIMGVFLRIDPAGVAAGNYRLWYVPEVVYPATDSTNMDQRLLTWEQYIVVESARKALVKEESGTAQVDAEKAALTARIVEMASDRDDARPDRIADVVGSDDMGIHRRRLPSP